LSEVKVIIVGAGIAGVSLGAELAPSCDVLILEQEAHPSMHASGRSAAAFIPSYGMENPALRVLTHLSLPALQSGMEGSAKVDLLKARGMLSLVPRGLGQDSQTELAENMASIAGSRPVCADDELLQRLRVNAGYAASGWFEPDVWDIDVNELLQACLRRLRADGGNMLTNAPVKAIRRGHGAWQVDTGNDTFSADLIVNCAGAWADEVAGLAGARCQHLVPMRRTAILLDPPDDCALDTWPLVYAADHSFYLKPDAGLLLASPADETPSQPLDVQPEEIDVATAAWRIEQAFTFPVSRIRHRWAGLRTFTPDRTPSIGADPQVDSFFWLVGQGGHGVQTAVASARLLASLICDRDLPDDFIAAGFDPALVSPAREFDQ